MHLTGNAPDYCDSDAPYYVQVMQRTMPGPRADFEPVGDSESDDIPSDIDDHDSFDSEVDTAETPGALSEDRSEMAGVGGDSSDGGVDFAEGDDDLIDLDEVVVPSPESEDPEAVSGKRKPSHGDTQEGGRKKKRKNGALPTFASYEDYAKLIEGAPEEDI